jgi:energy-coupling factor transport system substrate-specific component
MNESKKPNAQTMAVAAVMIAVVAVLTFAVQFPIPASGGYIHFGDVGVFFTAFAFGPMIGLLGGGVGCAIADILSGYASWAPLTLVAHGLQGLVAGYFGKGKGAMGMIVAWAVGEVGPNFVQEVVGGLVGIPLVLAIRRAYPPIERISLGRVWEEG